MQDTIIKIENVSKEYRLGTIGGGTLRGDLQSLTAKLRGKEDPNARIEQQSASPNQRFLALDNVSFSVTKGERVGIIGHNGAGKSTLLKLLSRVTSPTKGTISYNGRIASMLEVGTGFHPELTGRENIYLNGAILGMSKAEISEKFDAIVQFAEMEKFVDTPVKRYSSGMYVKLAFAVAAHLDSDILVMDEVLAVGDMKFQQKCLGKMDDVSKNQGKTVLYVSHNMNTIRQLCTRCIVMDHGSVIFDGDVEEAINLYLGQSTGDSGVNFDLSQKRMPHLPAVAKVKMTKLSLLNKDVPVYKAGERVNFKLTLTASEPVEQVYFRFELRYYDDSAVGTAQCKPFGAMKADGEKDFCLSFQTDSLTRGRYKCLLVIYGMNEFGNYEDYDAIFPAFSFELDDDIKLNWNTKYWGHVRFPDIEIL